MNINHFDQVVTPEQAKIWLAQNYKNQRKVNPVSVAMYKQAMLDNQFAPTSVLMFAVNGGELHLLNGQQTLHAIVESKIPQHLPILHYEVQNEQEEAKLYFKIDRQRRRNFADSVRATQLEGATGLAPGQIQRTAAALRFIKSNFGVDRKILISDDDMLELVEFWSWETKALWTAISPCSKLSYDLIRRQAVLSVALVTMRYSLPKAREFWRQVAQDDGLVLSDPRKTLLRWLSTKTIRHHERGREPVYPHEIARAVASAWNAFMENKPLKVIQVGNAFSRMYLKGTAYNGHQDPDFLPLYVSPHLEAERTGQPAQI